MTLWYLNINTVHISDSQVYAKLGIIRLNIQRIIELFVVKNIHNLYFLYQPKEHPIGFRS